MMSHKILQLSDTHLFESAEERLFGVSTNTRFMQVVDFIRNNRISFDDILLTGDISQDETPASYEIIANQLSQFKKEIYWIAGNHDDMSKMYFVFKKYPLFHYADHWLLDNINWKFIFVDSVLTGKDSGHITKNALDQLTYDLAFTPESVAVAVIMHHHPFPVGTPLIDQFLLDNTDDLYEAIVKSDRKIELIICGHVHENYDLTKDNIRLISSPATCLQWKKGTEKMAIRDVAGFNLWTFSKSGKFAYETYFI